MPSIARQEMTDDLDALMAALPTEIVERLRSFADRSDLLEVVMDLGRRPEARFVHGEEVLLDREIGDADIAHVVNHIGVFGDDNRAGIERRLQVRPATEQHAVMMEAVENHMPEVIVIDEIGTELEAAAARTIAERGVQLVGTAHGNTLDNLMLNPTLSDLVGGIQTVTLGDEEARRRGTQKTVLERKAPPTFDVVVEIVERDNVIVHGDVAETVDAILRGHMVPPEARWRSDVGEVQAATKYDYRISETAAGNPA